MKQRTLVLFRILCAFAAGFVIPCAYAAPPAPLARVGRWVGSSIVMTRYGEIQGSADAEDTWKWAAIPFAHPPVGEYRWRAPEDPDPWNGVRDVQSFNAGCSQFSPVVTGRVYGSEDCLYLNVWRPRGPATGLPVYAWIHGGSNATGSATMVPDYYGTGIAGRSHMVFVSLNYRLGPFGWFTHPALRRQATPYDASGNYGKIGRAHV
jgi:para-nitrobenzyl esterase